MEHPSYRSWGRLSLTLLVAGMSVGQAAVTRHADGSEPQKLVATDGVADGRFGVGLDVSGAYAVIGGRALDEAGGFEGLVYVFRKDARGAWEEHTRLTHPDGLVGAGFGAVVAIDGDVIVVGESTADDACPGDPACDSGAVHVFTRDPVTDTWSVAQRLVPDDGASGDQFGVSVAIDGDVIAVGAFKARDSGAVYVFDRARGERWTQRARLADPAPTPGAWFGLRVAVQGTVIAATAPAGEAVPPNNVRRVHVFERSRKTTHAWVHVTALESGSPSDGFAASVALGPDALLVGAPGDDAEGVNAGAARVYRRAAAGDWTAVAKLTEPCPAAQRSFGAAVAMDRAVAGVSSLPLLSVGALRTYRLAEAGDPVPLEVLAPKDAVASDLFGLAIALDAGALVTSAVGDDEVASGAGAVYAFKLRTGATCPGDLTADGEVGFEDLLDLLAVWGPCVDCPQDLDGDGEVGFRDLLQLLVAWGPCGRD